MVKMHRRAGLRASGSGFWGSASALAVAIGLSAAAAHAQEMPALDEGEDAILVTGFRQSIITAIAEKKNTDLILESISAEDIGKLPDQSIADAIARLPGLTTQRLGGRAQQITIRGFAPDFSTTLLNGREQVTAGDNRGVEFDQYPAEIISQVNVYKTASAGLVGQGLSGTVDLLTARPLGVGKRVIAVNGRVEKLSLGKLNAGSDDVGYRLTGTYIDQFADGTVGVALAVTHLSSPTQINRFNAWGYPDVNGGPRVIGGSKPYVISTDLKRTGVLGTIEYEPSDTFNMAIDAYYTKFKDNQIKRGIELPLFWSSAQLQPGFAAESGLVTSGTFDGVKGVVRNDFDGRDADLFSLGWNARIGRLDVLQVTIDASYSRVDREDLVLETYAGTGRGFDENGSVGATDRLGFTMTDRGAVFAPTLNYADPSLIRLTSPQGWGGDIIPGGQDGYSNTRSIKDELAAFRFQAERELGGGFRSVEVGANYTYRSKSLVPDEFFLGLVGNTDGRTSVPIPSAALLNPTALKFLGIPGMVSYDPVALRDSGIYNLVRNPNADVTTKAWAVREDVFTGWLKVNLDAELGSNRLTGNVGVQVVHTDQRSSGSASSGTGTGVVTIPISDSTSYTYALPSVNLALRTDDDWVFRFGAGRQLARPRMDDMRASINFNYNPGLAGSTDISQSPWSGGGGNPQLRPWVADALDFTVEKYFLPEGYVAVAAFYKKLKSYIYEQPVLFNFAGFPTGGGPEPALREGFVRIWSNGDGGELYGVEMTAVIPFKLFTPALEGFGVLGSYSITESRIQPDPNSPPQNLPGFSRDVWNATAYFERSGFSIRGSLRHRSSFIGEIRAFGGGNERRRAAAETVLDGQIGYEFQEGALKGLTITAQGYNLTNEPFVTFVNDDRRQVQDYEEYGRRFLFGVGYRF
jgi:iron complex outermembrane receptor protein